MSVQEGAAAISVKNNPDLERLETALVQLGFALEQQEIQVEAERTQHEETSRVLLAKVERLEARIRAFLQDGHPVDAAPAQPVANEEG